MWWLMISVFVIYNLIILLKYGFLNSISVSYYSLPVKWNWLFLAFCWLYAIPAIMLATDGFMFFSGGLICWVGIASAFRQDKFTAEMHTRSALAAVVLSQLSILFCYQNYWLIGVMVVCSGGLFLIRNTFKQWMTVLEWIAFVTVAYTLK